MADITIAGSVASGTSRGIRAVVFVNSSTGYVFLHGSAVTFIYKKTTDGGATWGANVTIQAATTQCAFDVWFDQWTPGDTGTLIHMWYFDTTNDKVFWRSLDTNGDILGTERTAFTGASAVQGRGSFCSGTKTRSGYLYVAFDIDAGAEHGIVRSTDSGTTWSSNLATTFVEATIDECILFPATGTGDNNDCWAIYQDASADALTMKMWDSSAAAEVESSTIQTMVENVTDGTGQRGFSGSVRHSDGHLIIVSCSEYDTATADMQVWEISGVTAASQTGVTHLTDITTNIDDNYNPSLFIDQITNDIYVAYNGKSDGSEVIGTTTKVYYIKSTDGGSSWTGANSAYTEGATAVVTQVWAPIMGYRFCAAWRSGGTNLLFNKVNSIVTMSPRFTGALSFAGSQAKSSAKALAGALSFVVGVFTKTHLFSLALTATLNLSGSILKRTLKSLVAALSFIGRWIPSGFPINATLSFVGSIPKRAIPSARTATLSFVGACLKASTFTRLFTARLRLLDGTDNVFDSAYEPLNSDFYPIDTVDGKVGYGQSFISRGGTLKSVYCWVYQVGTISGDVFAKLYSVTGTHGVNAKPGTLLATSNTGYDATFLPFSDFFPAIGLTFSGAQQYVMKPGTAYCLEMFWNGGGDASNYIAIARSSQPSVGISPEFPMDDPGNAFSEGPVGTWTALPGEDVPFQISIRTLGGLTTLPEKLFLATLSFVGSLTRRTGHLSTAALSFVGSFTKSIVRALTGALSFVGALTKAPRKLLTATLSFIGSVTRAISRLSTATLSFVGSFTKQTAHALIAALSFVGATTRRTAKLISGALSFIGTFIESELNAITLTGALSFAGNLSKTPSKLLAGALSFAGSLLRQTGKLLSGTLSFVGALTRLLGHLLNGALSFAGTLTKRTSRTLTATLSFIGSCLKSFSKTFTASLSSSGNLRARGQKLLAASLTFTGAIIRRISHMLSAALTFVGNFVIAGSNQIILVATLAFSGSTTKSITHTLSGTLSFVGACLKTLPRTLSATLSFTGTTLRSVSRQLNGSLSLIGSLFKQTSRTFSAVLSFLGDLASSLVVGTEEFFQTLIGTLSFNGAITNQPRKSLTAALSFVGSITKSIATNVAGTLSFVGEALVHLITDFAREFTATLSFSGSIWRRMGRFFPIVIETIIRFAKIIVPATVIHEVPIDVTSDAEARIARIVVPGPY